jgi:hypothetical protein
MAAGRLKFAVQKWRESLPDRHEDRILGHCLRQRTAGVAARVRRERQDVRLITAAMPRVGEISSTIHLWCVVSTV